MKDASEEYINKLSDYVNLLWHTPSTSDYSAKIRLLFGAK